MDFLIFTYTAQNMQFSIKDFFNICDQIHSFLQIWSDLLKKSIIGNLIFCAVLGNPQGQTSFFSSEHNYNQQYRQWNSFLYFDKLFNEGNKSWATLIVDFKYVFDNMVPLARVLIDLLVFWFIDLLIYWFIDCGNVRLTDRWSHKKTIENNRKVGNHYDVNVMRCDFKARPLNSNLEKSKHFLTLTISGQLFFFILKKFENINSCQVALNFE